MGKNNNNKMYIYDINKIIDFVIGDPNDRTRDSEIIETYKPSENGNDIVLDKKVVKEVKISDNSANFGVRYDLIKSFIEIINEVEDTDLVLPRTSFGSQYNEGL